MSEPAISKREIAQFIKDVTDGDMDAGDGISQSVLAANMMWSLWDTLGESDTDPDISDEEAEEILSQMPLDYDDVAGG
jgi:hypothetical protein